MSNFSKITMVLTALAAVIAAGLALKKVHAQTTLIQPFTAIEINEAIAGPGHGPFGKAGVQLPTPRVYTKTIAVRSDGSVVIAQVVPHSEKVTQDYWTRMVYNAADKTKIFYDPMTKSAVHLPYLKDQSMQGDALCTGKMDGQIEGFDVVYNQSPTQTLSDGEIIVLKTWAAPKLGCFVIKWDRVATHEGQLMAHLVRTVSNIELGEPDPWYFSDDATLIPRTHEEWQDLYLQAK
jgi:hypothetical protein